jgi:hypothetical protein
MSATLEGGWNLTEIGSKIDSKVPETIQALTAALQAVGGIASLRTSLTLEEGFWRIDFDKSTGFVSGLKKVPLLAQ